MSPAFGLAVTSGSVYTPETNNVVGYMTSYDIYECWVTR